MGRPMWRAEVARSFLAGAFVCGVIGLVAGITHLGFLLGTFGWFQGGILLAFIALVLVIDQYGEDRRKADSS